MLQFSGQTREAGKNWGDLKQSCRAFLHNENNNYIYIYNLAKVHKTLCQNVKPTCLLKKNQNEKIQISYVFQVYFGQSKYAFLVNDEIFI